MKNPYANIPPIVWLLTTITFVSRSGTMVLVFLPLYLIQNLGCSVILAGEMVSFYGLGNIVGSYLGGMLADSFGLMRLQKIGFLLTGMAYLLIGVFSSKMAIVGAIFFSGLFYGATRPAINASIAKYSTPEIRHRAYALSYQAGNIGSTIGPVIGGLLATLSYSWLFIVDGGANIVAAILVWYCFRNKPDSPAHADTKLDDVIDIPTWKDALFVKFLCLAFLIGTCFYLVMSLYPIYLQTVYGLAADKVGIVIAFNGLLIILFQMHVTAYLKQFNELRVIGWGGLFIGLGFFILPFSSGLYYGILSMCIITLGEMTSMSLLFDYVTKIAPLHKRGFYLGLLITFLLSVPLIVTPNAGSYIYNTYGPTTLWTIAGVLGIVVWIGFQWLASTYKEPVAVIDRIESH